MDAALIPNQHATFDQRINYRGDVFFPLVTAASGEVPELHGRGRLLNRLNHSLRLSVAVRQKLCRGDYENLVAVVLYKSPGSRK